MNEVKMEKELRIAIFVSRNKDNVAVEDFKQRRKEFLTYKNSDKLLDAFIKFARQGRPNEVSRFYMSVNTRDPLKTRDELVIKIMERGDQFDTTRVETLAVSAAAQAKCALTKNWLFDVDTSEEEDIKVIEKYINLKTSNNYEKFRTYNHYGFIVYKHFDPRELIEMFPDKITLKRDGMMYVYAFKN